MAISGHLSFASIALALLLISASVRADEPADVAVEHEEPAAPEAVIALDASNFTEVVEKHSFIVVEFYAPWCGHCRKLAPEYEKAAAALLENDPVVTLAKVDATAEENKDLASQFNIDGFPTILILREKGKRVQEYNGPREAEGIIEYVKKQLGPASVEITSPEDATRLIVDKKVIVVGIFSDFSGSAFESFMEVAEKKRADYDFGHTLDAKLLPRGDATAKGPVVRLFKPFDELVVDYEEFDVEALEKFMEKASMPKVVTFNKDPANHNFLLKFFTTRTNKAMLFLDFNSENLGVFKAQMHESADFYQGQNMSFLIGDQESAQAAFQIMGLKEEHMPLMIIQAVEGPRYAKPNVEPDQIAPWLKDFLNGDLKPYKRSQPVPEENDEPIKVVVADSFDNVVLDSGKNVLLHFYAPKCSHCHTLNPILEEVAVSLQGDESIVIAKMDATANEIPREFEMQKNYPTVYLRTSLGRLVLFEGNKTAEEITEFIQKNKDTSPDHDESATTRLEEVAPPADHHVKDEL